jgi:hypothetical protein
MASTTSLPEPTFTKPITSMNIVELRQTCQYFELPQTGITPTIRNRLRNFLTAHKHEIQHDYDFVALYPNRDPIQNRNQPADNSQGSQAFSQWNGIGDGEPAPPNLHQRAPSVVAKTNNRVEEYLQSKSLHPHRLLSSPLRSHPLHAMHSPSHTSLAPPSTTPFQLHRAISPAAPALHLALTSTTSSAGRP